MISKIQATLPVAGISRRPGCGVSVINPLGDVRMRNSTPFGVQKAFTLLELLIVIAITAALAILAMSVTGSLRQRSYDVKCQANLRSLGAAGLSYATERNGLLPQLLYWRDPVRPSSSLYPYLGLPVRTSSQAPIRMASVLTCPSIQASGFKTESEQFCTYSINQYATGAGGGEKLDDWTKLVKEKGAPLRLSNVRNPSAQAFFLDGTALWQTGAYIYSAYDEPRRLLAATGDKAATWRTPYIHHDRINVVFLDGHVETITLEYAERELMAKDPATTRKNPFWGATD